MLKSAVLSVVVLVIGMTIVEIVLRTTHLFGARIAWTEPDEYIAWRFTPEREYWFFNENDHAITGRINSHGWRDRERDVEKNPHSFRVAVIGDSYVEAFQVEEDSTFLSIAERELTNNLGRPVEVLNFGRSGFAQAEEHLVLNSDVFAFDPDLVVLVFVPSNDIGDVDRRTALTTLRPFFRDDNGTLVVDRSFSETREFGTKQKINRLKQYSALVSLVAERYNVFAKARRKGDLDENGEPSSLPRHLTLWTSRPDSVYVENLALCKSILELSALECRARGIDFLLVGQHLTYTDDGINACRSLESSFDPDGLDHDLGAWAQARGIGYLGLQGPFRERHVETGERLHWSHWNYAGHRVVAAALVRSVQEGLSPGAGPTISD